MLEYRAQMLQSFHIGVGDWNGGLEGGRARPQRVDVQRSPRHEGAAVVEGVFHFQTQLSCSHEAAGTNDLQIIGGWLAWRECGQCQDADTREESNLPQIHFWL